MTGDPDPVGAGSLDPPGGDELVRSEARRRRTVAIISHPDAGKSTLTEALLLNAEEISEAGVTHGKRGRVTTVSDWMALEQQRGISISSAAVRCTIGDTVITVVDTPGHADFSEDTYRALAAVDAVIMLIDAAKGMETQTRKLFEVCRTRRLPVITMVNKWDRPGRSALELMDEIERETSLVPTPLTWPIGIAGDFLGLIDCAHESMIKIRQVAAGAQQSDEDPVAAAAADSAFGPSWREAMEEVRLLRAEGQVHDQETFIGCLTTPVLFGSAVLNLGTRRLLEALDTIAPSPPARIDASGQPVPLTAPFTGYVFKVQSGMNARHRDRFAYIRVCSGHFSRGMTLQHSTSGRPVPTRHAQNVFGNSRGTLADAWPGDVIGLVNAPHLQPGDTLHGPARKVVFPPMPRFLPEHFTDVHPTDSSKHKQFHRGLTMLDSEGAVQLLTSPERPQDPILGAVGQLQFDVVADRMRHEFNCPVRYDSLSYTLALPTRPDADDIIGTTAGVRVVTRAADGQTFVLVTDRWTARALGRRHPELGLLADERLAAHAP